MRAKFRIPALAATATLALAAFGPATPAHAVFVTYTTVGTFTGGDAAGTNVFLDAANGVNVVFNGIVSNSVDVPPASSASFGTFDTSGTTSPTLTGANSGFTLDIFQTTPVAGGPLTFVGSLIGQLATTNSQAYIQFNAPLSQSLGDIVYKIISADSGTPGRLDLVPPSTNSGLSSLQAQITAVPEPSSVILMGVGGMLALAFRRRGKALLAA